MAGQVPDHFYINIYIRMVKSHCVKQKKQTECVEPSGYKTAKNGRLTFWCTCAECGMKKNSNL